MKESSCPRWRTSDIWESYSHVKGSWRSSWVSGVNCRDAVSVLDCGDGGGEALSLPVSPHSNVHLCSQDLGSDSEKKMMDARGLHDIFVWVAAVTSLCMKEWGAAAPSHSEEQIKVVQATTSDEHWQAWFMSGRNVSHCVHSVKMAISSWWHKSASLTVAQDRHLCSPPHPLV